MSCSSLKQHTDKKDFTFPENEEQRLAFTAASLKKYRKLFDTKTKCNKLRVSEAEAVKGEPHTGLGNEAKLPFEEAKAKREELDIGGGNQAKLCRDKCCKNRKSSFSVIFDKEVDTHATPVSDDCGANKENHEISGAAPGPCKKERGKNIYG